MKKYAAQLNVKTIKVDTRYTTYAAFGSMEFNVLIRRVRGKDSLWQFALYVWPTYRKIDLVLDRTLCLDLGHARRLAKQSLCIAD